ncbi:hypothetical protein LY76DRAFT_118985 [Colletotrichum caudatum]|nr:hypothetical protein LY76DRAFT_118985 [Colletotrichum caudatum]
MCCGLLSSSSSSSSFFNCVLLILCICATSREAFCISTFSRSLYIPTRLEFAGEGAPPSPLSMVTGRQSTGRVFKESFPLFSRAK